MTKKLWLSVLLLALVFGVGLYFGQAPDRGVTAAKLSLDEQEATIQAINKAMPAVVSISVWQEEELAEITPAGALVKKQKVSKGQGSGFLISADGLILTNKHVVEAATTKDADFKVLTAAKKEYYAQLIGKDPLNDLAVLKIYDNKLPYLEMGTSAKTPVGMTVMAIGNALGRYKNSVTKGIVSGIGRTVEATDPNKNGIVILDNVLQTDAEINEGNSGGPLINLEGKVVGVNVAVDKGGSGLGFAIPIDDARSVVDSVRRTGRIIRTRLGIRYEMLTPLAAVEKKLAKDYGALITKDATGQESVVSGGPADKAGLKEGDIIFEVNAIKIDGFNTILSVIQRFKPGDRVGLKVQRGSEVLTVIVVLDEFKEMK